MSAWAFSMLYASPDGTVAQKLVEYLHPHPVCADFTALKPGDPWQQRLPELLAQAPVVLILLSRHAADATYLQSEIARFLHRDERGKRRLVPVLLENVALPYGLDPFQALHAYHLSLEEVARQIRGLVPSIPPSPAPRMATLGRQLREEFQPFHPAVSTTPFQVGPPATGSQFYGREEVLEAITDRVMRGVPVALTGEPRIGKTSVLRAVEARERWAVASHFLASDPWILPSFFSADAVPPRNGPAFWQRALLPLAELAVPALTTLLQQAESRNYDALSLETLARHLQKEGIRLLLLVDEYDSFIALPEDDDRPERQSLTSFLGRFRNLMSNYNHSFSVVTASRLSHTQLDEHAGPLCAGSPPHNTMQEVTIGPLNQAEAGELLAAGRLSETDRRFLMELGGQHPALLSAGASALHQGRPRKEALTAAWKVCGQMMEPAWRRWGLNKKAAFLLSGFRVAEAPAQLSGRFEFLQGRGYAGEDRRLASRCLQAWFQEKVGTAERDSFEGWLRALGLASIDSPSTRTALRSCYDHHLPRLQGHGLALLLAP